MWTATRSATAARKCRWWSTTAANGSPVFVKVYDLDRRSNVRHVYVLAHETLTIEKLAAGKYEVRYQNIEAGGSQAECLGRKRALRQAATDAEI